MENVINDRIIKLIELFDMNPNSFAETIGVKGTVIFNIIKGRRNKPSYDVLEKILTSFEEVSAKWLIRGQGAVLQKVNDRDGLFLNLPEVTGHYKRKEHVLGIVKKLETDYKINKHTLRSLKNEIQNMVNDNIEYRDRLIQMQENQDRVKGILKNRMNINI